MRIREDVDNVTLALRYARTTHSIPRCEGYVVTSAAWGFKEIQGPPRV